MSFFGQCLSRLESGLLASMFLVVNGLFAQPVLKTMLKLPDTGQTGDYTAIFGEDSDYTLQPPKYIKHNNGTVTDAVTNLMWQQADGGEMTYERAILYADTLTLGGFSDWRLPTALEANSILNHQLVNPALDGTYFIKTTAEYWWTSDRQANDPARIWCTNAGGGIGNHSKTETLSAGGSKRYHVRAVRSIEAPVTLPTRFTDNGDGTVTDHRSGLIWQKHPNPDTVTWENALRYAENLTLGGLSDWRLPNIKELQSLNDERIINPSVPTAFFPNVGSKRYWSSTSIPNRSTQAWYLYTQFGITTYQTKTYRLGALCVHNAPTVTKATEVLRAPLSISAFPNPASDRINLVFRLSEAAPLEVDIWDGLGRLVHRFSLPKGVDQASISVADWATGVYMVRVSTQQGGCLSTKCWIERQ